MHLEKTARITDLQNQLFPNGSLQERKSNFSAFYSDEFVSEVILHSNPFYTNFVLVTI